MKHFSYCFIITVLFYLSTNVVLGMDNNQPNVGATASNFIAAIQTSSDLGLSRTDSLDSCLSLLNPSVQIAKAQDNTANEFQRPDHPELDAIDGIGRTPIMQLIINDSVALEEGEDNFKIIEELIDQGAKINRQDNAGFTAIMHICSSRTHMVMGRRIQYAVLLLNKGAHVNFFSFDKRSNARTLLAILQQTVPETELENLQKLIQYIDQAQLVSRKKQAISPKDWERATTPSPQISRSGSRFDVDF